MVSPWRVQRSTILILAPLSARLAGSSALAGPLVALNLPLYYSDDPELEQTVVLRPEWVNEYISLVLDSKPVDEAHGLLSRAEMARLWSSLDRGMREHFLGVMDKYEISFRVDGGATGIVSLVLERLPWNPPPFEDEWARLAEIPSIQEIRVRYQLNTMPPGIPTWFIARSHRFTTSTHWRTGALLAHPDGVHKALLRAQPRRNTVELTVRGPNPAASSLSSTTGSNRRCCATRAWRSSEWSRAPAGLAAPSSSTTEICSGGWP